jgi:HIRAN domain.
MNIKEGGSSIMDRMYFTITGMNYRYGQKFLERGMKVRLVKEPDNNFDSEAIKVEIDGLGHIGYVANSPYTIAGESMSAGRLYDKIGEEAYGTVMYVLENGALGMIDHEDKDQIL